MKIWMGWTKRETGSAGLRCIHGDAGKAYGLQFDYRYGLVPFMQYCVDYNPERYSGFKPYIALGAGNEKLIYNKGLGYLWQQLYDAYTEEFEQLQFVNAYQRYYIPAAEYVLKNYGINMADHHPAVRGTLFSMSFRSGQETGAQKFRKCDNYMPDEKILSYAYATYGDQDAGRWTKAGQWGDAVNALYNDEYTELITSMDSKKGGLNNMKKVLLIAGHGKQYSGGYDPGACSKWGQEADYTRELANLIKNKIGNALDVTMYPQNQDCYSFSRNGQKPDYGMYDFTLEIHFNAKTNKDPDGNGYFTGTGGYYHPDNSGAEIGKAITKAIADKGFKFWLDCESTGLLNLNNAQSVGARYYLLETAFIDDGDDMTWYNAHKDDVAEAIATTLISKLSGIVSQSEKALYIVQAGFYTYASNATKTATKMRNKGIDCIVKPKDKGYMIQCGAFEKESNAKKCVEELKENSFIKKNKINPFCYKES